MKCTHAAIFFGILGLISVTSAWSLVVDEKLTVRILKVSDTKKTVLLNRGLEDGLVKGDHAKFYLSTGVVGRGVIMKAAPSRSIWAMYRVVDQKKITTDAVMNIKISTPVKLSKDRTKIVYTPTRPVGTNLLKTGIVLAEGADDVPELSDGEQTDLAALESDTAEVPLIYRNWEIWGILQLTDLSSTTNANTGGESDPNLDSQGEITNWDFAIGFEYYFSSLNEWYSNFSLAPFFRYNDFENSSLAGRNIRLRLYEVGVGLNWHFWHRPHEVRTLIGYASLAGGAGSIREFTVQADSGVLSETSLQGSEQFYQLGVGLKYYIHVGFGLRGVIDYYRRGTTYESDIGGAAFERTTHGFRYYLGLSWRI